MAKVEPAETPQVQTQKYFFPDYGVTLEAVSKEDAEAQLKKLAEQKKTNG